MPTQADLDRALQAAQCSGNIQDAADILDVEVEHISTCGRELTYCNTGDTYDITICQEGEKFWLGSWGDWVETVEGEYGAENNAVRCGYCGEWTPTAEEWRETRCENCGRNVATGEVMPEPKDEDEDEEEDE